MIQVSPGINVFRMEKVSPSSCRVHPMTYCDVIAGLSDQLPITISLKTNFIASLISIYLVLIP